MCLSIQAHPPQAFSSPARRRLDRELGPRQERPGISLPPAVGGAANPGPHCRGVTVPRAHALGGWHTCCVLLHCPSTDPCSKKGCVKSGEAGLASASWTRCPRGQAWDQSRWSREKGNTRGTALVTQLISVTAATVKGF